MSLESFYGGKPGISPIIKKSFKYVNEQDPAYVNKTQAEKYMAVENNEVMEACFADPNYKDVWYEELAIIDAENRNNPNHGRLYRRTLNRGNTNDLGTRHAEYIGTLAGPAGGFPQTNIIKFESFKTDVNQYGVSYIYPGSSGIEEGTYYNFRNGVQEQAWNVSTDLVPGKDENGNYNDEVKYYWVNVVNNTDKGEEKNTIYLGFKIPYPVFDFDIESTDWTKDFSAERIDEQNHPFFTNTKLSIPIGVKGNSVGNFRKETIIANSNDLTYNPIYLYENFCFDDQGLLVTDDVNGDPINDSSKEKIAPINNNPNYSNKQVWVYDFSAYGRFQDNKNTTCKKFTCYLGEIKEIEEITVTGEGIIKVKYLNDEVIPINDSNRIKYIKNTEYNSSNGKMTINYNTEETDTFNIPGLESIFIDNRGQVSYKLTTSSNQTFLNKLLSFVTGIDINNNTKQVSIVKTTGTEPTSTYLKSIESVTFDNPTGNLTINYNTKEEDGETPATYTIKNFRPPAKNAGIAAELYTDLLRAIAICQKKYYSSDYIDENLRNTIENIKTENLPTSTIEAIIRGDWNTENKQSFWLLQRKYFNNPLDFDDLRKEARLELKYAIEPKDESETIEGESEASEDENLGYFNFYPYDDGNIRFFKTEDIEWTKLDNKDEKFTTALEVLKLQERGGDERKGQLLYYNSNAFYYDGNMGQWKYAGTWNSVDDKSHIQILQYDVNGKSKPIDTNFNLSEAGFYFEQRQVSSNNPEAGILLGEFLNENQTI